MGYLKFLTKLEELGVDFNICLWDGNHLLSPSAMIQLYNNPKKFEADAYGLTVKQWEQFSNLYADRFKEGIDWDSFQELLKHWKDEQAHL